MKKVFNLLAIFFAMTVLLTACGGNDSIPFIIVPTPTITAVAPSYGLPGTTVTITGTNFSTTAANNAVEFNGTAAVVTTSTKTEIVTTVPAGATSGLVTVTVRGKTATSPGIFTVTEILGGTVQGHALTLSTLVSTLVAPAAGLSSPSGITTDGTNLYVADFGNNVISKIVIATGVVSTLAGSGAAGSDDGIGILATFDGPAGMTTDGTNIYLTDYNNNLIRQIVIATGEVTTLAGSGAPGADDGIGAAASFDEPYGITTDGTNLYVADRANNLIRQIEISTATVTTIAGSGAAGFADGIGAAAVFNGPTDVTTDGTNLYVADRNNNMIRQIELATATVSTLAGSGAPGFADGIGAAATFDGPNGLTMDGTNLYVADRGNNLIRKIVIATADVTTLAGSGAAGSADGIGVAATFDEPYAITTDGTNLYLTDYVNNSIRMIE